MFCVSRGRKGEFFSGADFPTVGRVQRKFAFHIGAGGGDFDGYLPRGAGREQFDFIFAPQRNRRDDFQRRGALQIFRIPCRPARVRR